MKKSRFTEEQMVKALREADATSVAEVAKKLGVAEQTLYVWRMNDVNYMHPSTTTTSPHPVERPTSSASLWSG